MLRLLSCSWNCSSCRGVREFSGFVFFLNGLWLVYRGRKSEGRCVGVMGTLKVDQAMQKFLVVHTVG